MPFQSVPIPQYEPATDIYSLFAAYVPNIRLPAYGDGIDSPKLSQWAARHQAASADSVKLPPAYSNRTQQ